MRPITLCVLVGALNACLRVKSPSEPVSLADDTGIGDTDGADSDSAAGGDSETGADRPDGDATATFTLTGDWEGTTLTLTQIDPTSGYSWGVGDRVASEAVEGDSVDVTLSAPDVGDLIQPDPDAWPDLWFLPLAAALHVDLDGNGGLTGDESYVGVGAVWVTWVEGEIPDTWAEKGVVEGWNAMSYANDGVTPVVGRLSGVPVDAGLAPSDAVTVGGSWTGGGTSDVCLILLPAHVMAGGEVDELLVDEPLEDPWTITMSGDPPEDHYSRADALGGEIVFEFPYAFHDVDGGGTLDDGDDQQRFACDGDAAVAVAYIPPVHTLYAGFQLGRAELRTGWLALSISADHTGELPAEDALALELSDACSYSG